MCHEPKFFICKHCGNLVVMIEKAGAKIICCDQPMNELVPNTVDTSSEKHLPVITFTGGFSANAATVSIGNIPHPMTEEHHIEWVYLQTVQGGQFKYLAVGQDPVVTFALADKDAYSFCDRPICKMGREHCMFKCKRGFAAYAYCNLHGLWKTHMQ
ncbi:desulfoferrodoxin [Desulfallas sp. Bu1-1]|uniref:desulfoferrodoxin family protein n=1 Tax=Desulfallas sp. Bu1-1 TaxID=2787620 RepID=UPI00189C93EA|nr:desulfoferrodoxin family protein [Desulfallas sp. Bu1-1]MBF7082508.1 desulfoferrodoxin [Desulfallas sp. Bu1-1]